MLNDSWGGSDHYANFMVLFTGLNSSAEFRYGPGEVKMIAIGMTRYRLVLRFGLGTCAVARGDGGALGGTLGEGHHGSCSLCWEVRLAGING